MLSLPLFILAFGLAVWITVWLPFVAIMAAAGKARWSLRPYLVPLGMLMLAVAFRHYGL